MASNSGGHRESRPQGVARGADPVTNQPGHPNRGKSSADKSDYYREKQLSEKAECEANAPEAEGEVARHLGLNIPLRVLT